MLSKQCYCKVSVSLSSPWPQRFERTVSNENPVACSMLVFLARHLQNISKPFCSDVICTARISLALYVPCTSVLGHTLSPAHKGDDKENGASRDEARSSHHTGDDDEHMIPLSWQTTLCGCIGSRTVGACSNLIHCCYPKPIHCTWLQVANGNIRGTRCDGHIGLSSR